MDLAGGGQSTSKSTCEVPAWTLTAFSELIQWRSICIQHVQIEAGLNSDPGNDSFWDKWLKSVRLTMLIDLLTGRSTCRSTKVNEDRINWPLTSRDVYFTFSEMLALVESESSFGAYVCHRRPGGSLATSDLVGIGAQRWHCQSDGVITKRKRQPASLALCNMALKSPSTSPAPPDENFLLCYSICSACATFFTYHPLPGWK